MKKIINSLSDVPDADAVFKGQKNSLKAGKISPKEFLERLHADFGDELLNITYTSWRGLKQRAKTLHSVEGIP